MCDDQLNILEQRTIEFPYILREHRDDFPAYPDDEPWYFTTSQLNNRYFGMVFNQLYEFSQFAVKKLLDVPDMDDYNYFNNCIAVSYNRLFVSNRLTIFEVELDTMQLIQISLNTLRNDYSQYKLHNIGQNLYVRCTQDDCDTLLVLASTNYLVESNISALQASKYVLDSLDGLLLKCGDDQFYQYVERNGELDETKYSSGIDIVASQNGWALQIETNRIAAVAANNPIFPEEFLLKYQIDSLNTKQMSYLEANRQLITCLNNIYSQNTLNTRMQTDIVQYLLLFKKYQILNDLISNNIISNICSIDPVELSLCQNLVWLSKIIIRSFNQLIHNDTLKIDQFIDIINSLNENQIKQSILTLPERHRMYLSIFDDLAYCYSGDVCFVCNLDFVLIQKYKINFPYRLGISREDFPTFNDDVPYFFQTYNFESGKVGAVHKKIFKFNKQNVTQICEMEEMPRGYWNNVITSANGIVYCTNQQNLYKLIQSQGEYSLVLRQSQIKGIRLHSISNQVISRDTYDVFEYLTKYEIFVKLQQKMTYTNYVFDNHEFILFKQHDSNYSILIKNFKIIDATLNSITYVANGFGWTIQEVQHIIDNFKLQQVDNIEQYIMESEIGQTEYLEELVATNQFDLLTNAIEQGLFDKLLHVDFKQLKQLKSSTISKLLRSTQTIYSFLEEYNDCETLLDYIQTVDIHVLSEDIINGQLKLVKFIPKTMNIDEIHQLLLALDQQFDMNYFKVIWLAFQYQIIPSITSMALVRQFIGNYFDAEEAAQFILQFGDINNEILIANYQKRRKISDLLNNKLVNYDGDSLIETAIDLNDSNTVIQIISNRKEKYRGVFNGHSILSMAIQENMADLIKYLVENDFNDNSFSLYQLNYGEIPINLINKLVTSNVREICARPLMLVNIATMINYINGQSLLNKLMLNYGIDHRIECESDQLIHEFESVFKFNGLVPRRVKCTSYFGASCDLQLLLLNDACFKSFGISFDRDDWICQEDCFKRSNEYYSQLQLALNHEWVEADEYNRSAEQSEDW